MLVRRLLQAVSMLALAATIAPSLAFLGGAMGIDAMKTLMLVATVVWFVVTPIWMGRAAEEQQGPPAGA